MILMDEEYKSELTINAFDFDGVVSIGIFPGPNDIIVTGRAIDEVMEVSSYLHMMRIFVPVYFNPISKSDREKDGNKSSRIISAHHKCNILRRLESNGVRVLNFFEDDDLQKEIIQGNFPDIEVIHVVSSTVK